MTVKIDIRQQDQKIVKEILRRHLPSKTKVWVFGSRVTGQARRYSDLDLLIELEGKKPLLYDKKVELAFDFEESDLPYKVDIVDAVIVSDLFKKHISKDKRKFKI